MVVVQECVIGDRLDSVVDGNKEISDKYRVDGFLLLLSCGQIL